MDQNPECDNKDANPDQDESQNEDEPAEVSAEPGDTEQVETFFSTMNHRYGNAIQEHHIL